MRRWVVQIFLGLSVMIAASSRYAAQTTYGPVLGIEGDHFTVNGTPKFLVFVSYFDGLRASTSNRDSDLAWLGASNISGVRVFPNWHKICQTGTVDDGVIGPNGAVNQTRLDNLKDFLAKASSNGLVVDVSFAHGIGTSPMTVNQYKAAVAEVARQLVNFKNVLFDVENEYQINGLSDADVTAVMQAVRAVGADPSRKVTASRVGSASDAGTAARLDGMNIVAFHDPRDQGVWFTDARINQHITDIRNNLSPSVQPIYFQEPQSFDPGCENKEWDSDLSHADSAITAARARGAAAWTFHTRAGFKLNTSPMRALLTTAEQSKIEGLRALADQACWGADAVSIAPVSGSAPAAGGTGGSFSVAVNNSCTTTWSVSSDASWLSATPTSGNGAGTVQYSTTANTSASSRVGHLTVRGRTFTVNQPRSTTSAARIGSDYDGDGHSDLTVFRPTATTTNWYVRLSGAGYTTTLSTFWGNPAYDSGFMPVPGDYDGDGRTDFAVWSPQQGYWFIQKSSTNYTTSVSYFWGNPAYSSGIEPVPADYDGDGVTDLGVWVRNTGEWYVLTSSSNFASSMPVQVWGSFAYDPHLVPVPADYDGDLKADPAVWSPATGNWFVLKSTTSYDTNQSLTKLWGNPSYDANFRPLAADYDGDGKADLAAWSPGTGNWFITQSSTGYTNSLTYFWGNPTSAPFIPVILDVDGDSRADIGVWRPASGTWYWLTSSSNFQTSGSYTPWGIQGDIPTPHSPRDFPHVP